MDQSTGGEDDEEERRDVLKRVEEPVVELAAPVEVGNLDPDTHLEEREQVDEQVSEVRQRDGGQVDARRVAQLVRQPHTRAQQVARHAERQPNQRDHASRQPRHVACEQLVAARATNCHHFEWRGVAACSVDGGTPCRQRYEA